MPKFECITLIIESLPGARAQVQANIPTPLPGMRLETPAHALAIDALGWLGKQPAVAGFVYGGQPHMPPQCLHQIAEPDTQKPFMWAIQGHDGSAYMDEGCVSSVREDVQAEVDGLNSGLDADDDPYKVVPVYLAAAPQAVQAAVPDGWKLAPIKVPDSAFAWVSGGYPAGYKAGDKRDTAVVHERAQRTWEAILNGITAPAHPAEGVPAQTATAVPTELLERVVDSLASFAGNQPHKPADLQAWEELNDFLTHRAALAATQPAVQALDTVKQAIRDYHHALDTRQHGGVAASNALDAIQGVLGMHWTQGLEAEARTAQAKQEQAA